MADRYPDGTWAEAPGWQAIKRDGVWWGGDFKGLRLGEDWDIPPYAQIFLPGTRVTDPAEIARRVFAKRKELEAEAKAAPELCNAEIPPTSDDPFGWFCSLPAGHPDFDGEGGHRWI